MSQNEHFNSLITRYPETKELFAITQKSINKIKNSCFYDFSTET